MSALELVCAYHRQVAPRILKEVGCPVLSAHFAEGCRLLLGPSSAFAQGRLSRKAREGAHPQLFRAMLKDKPALYFAVKVAHPPKERNSDTNDSHYHQELQKHD